MGVHGETDKTTNIEPLKSDEISLPVEEVSLILSGRDLLTPNTTSFPTTSKSGLLNSGGLGLFTFI
jgi:hypothetical protein